MDPSPGLRASLRMDPLFYYRGTCLRMDCPRDVACGAKYHLQEEDVDETDVDDVVVALVNMARRVSFAL